MQWIVVANASKARVLARVGRAEPEEIEDLVHPESRLHARDITTAPDGRQSSGGERRHAVEAKTGPKETEAVAFARELTEVLEKARLKNRFQELVLIAPPHFLGILRKQLRGPIEAKIVRTIEKNLVQTDLATVAAELDQGV